MKHNYRLPDSWGDTAESERRIKTKYTGTGFFYNII